MRITSWNILHGQPLSDQGSTTLTEALSELGSELIACQEVDHKLERSERACQGGDIAEAIGASYWGFAPTIEGTPGESWKKLDASQRRIITDTQEESGYYGISIASKVPVAHWLRKDLGRSWIGLPLAVSNEKGKPRFLYVKDEPRVAMAAVLKNGWTVINTHLSFVPLVNLYQLHKITRWAKAIEKEYETQVLLVGDFNLIWGIPSKVTKFKRATMANSYPSWKPAISFDYILARRENLHRMSEILHQGIAISDHRAISIDLKS